jgi:hypothetical protein
MNTWNETKLSNRETVDHKFEIPEWSTFTFCENAAGNHSIGFSDWYTFRRQSSEFKA